MRGTLTKNRVIEMHNKSFLVPLALVISIGGWFLWNILLSAIYHNNKIYYVKDSFFTKFGKNPLWWFTLILILVSLVAFEIAVISLRAAYWKTDVDTFQELERDLDVRMRFEEASAEFLASGWEGKGEAKRKKEEEKRKKEEEQSKREAEVGELLRNRPSGLGNMEGMQRLASAEEGSAGISGSRGGGGAGKRSSALLVEESNQEAVNKSGDVLDTLNRLRGKFAKKGD
jgi:phospholipid-translocating ATPase